MPVSQQAGLLCNEPQFGTFAAMRCGLINTNFNPHASAQYLRDVCKITSRRDLDTDRGAQQRFYQLRTNFDAWRGRIAAPR
ncbi:MAG: hypothetical protein AAFN94_00710 [Pseudomonadota bacterium]